jgi:hypothetical protein
MDLKKYINNLPIPINSPPQIMLLVIYLYADFICEECVAVASALPFQSSSVYSSELDAPQPDGFVADGDTSFSE